MFEYISPEQAGISSRDVTDYIEYLNRRGLAMHGILLMKGDKIFTECHWAPFNPAHRHRMYSETKSYVAIAIGFLVDEGKLSLSDRISDHFPEKIPGDLSGYLREQTVEEMLTMTTSGNVPYWFNTTEPDRTVEYFRDGTNHRPAGTLWEYDSAGSQVLCNLVEKLSGMTMLEYLKSKVFNRLGTFQNAQLLKARNEDSWGDSALICTQRDMASCARFLLDGGRVGGEQLLSEDYIKRATSPLVDNNDTGFVNWCHGRGYGYQIWHTEMDGFAFNGMGCQFTVAVPSIDCIFVCTADNQGYAGAGDLIVNGIFDMIFRKIQNTPLPEDKAAEADLLTLCRTQTLHHLEHRVDTPFAEEINGKVYKADKNRTGITEFAFRFKDGGGVFCYTNAQGYKELPFGLGYNEFGLFPQLGYSNEHGGVPTTDGFRYQCAASGGWTEEKKLQLKVQITDRYFGNFLATFAFKGKECAVRMQKTAEDFLNEYHGTFLAHCE